MTARVVERPPFFTFGSFEGWWKRAYQRGDHVTIIGPTKSGKTMLAQRLVRPRGYVVAVATKPEDSNMTRLMRHEGFRLSREWPPRSRKWFPPKDDADHPRWVFWPDVNRKDPHNVMDRLAEHQAKVIKGCMNDVFVDGGWTMLLDELYWLSDMLGLKRPLRSLWTQGRSLGISVVGLTQRPSWVPLEGYSQARHLFLFRTGMEADLIKLGSFGAANSRLIRSTVETLDDHEWLYVSTITGQMVRSKLDLAGTKKGPS